MEFGKSQRAMENREKWRKPVEKSSVVPQRPLRLTKGLMIMMMMIQSVIQGFLQLDDTGGQHDPHFRIIGSHFETLEGHTTHMLLRKG